jgi:hypothetical protein
LISKRVNGLRVVCPIKISVLFKLVCPIRLAPVCRRPDPPPGIFPLHLQDSPDGLPSPRVLFLEPKMGELYLTPAHHGLEVTQE